MGCRKLSYYQNPELPEPIKTGGKEELTLKSSTQKARREQLDEVKGSGNSLDFGNRIYDPRISNWLSIDPLQAKNSGMSPYSAFAGNLLMYVDPDGRDTIRVIQIKKYEWRTTTMNDVHNPGMSRTHTYQVPITQTGYQVIETPGKDKFFWDVWQQSKSANSPSLDKSIENFPCSRKSYCMGIAAKQTCALYHSSNHRLHDITEPLVP